MRQNQSKEPEPSSQTPSYRDLFQKVQLLIQIRWFSAIGILLIVLQEAILKHAVPSVIGKTLVIFFLVVALNTFYVLSVVRSFKRRPHLSTHYLWGFLLGQLIVDIFLMAAAIHFSGGIDSD